MPSGIYTRTEETKEKLSKNNSRYWEGKKRSKETINKMKLARKRQYGEKIGMWKGDKVGIDALHDYVINHKPKPKRCEKCKEEKRLLLANIKNHKYTRIPDDYKWLCYKCHTKLDFPDGRLGKNIKITH